MAKVYPLPPSITSRQSALDRQSRLEVAMLASMDLPNLISNIEVVPGQLRDAGADAAARKIEEVIKRLRAVSGGLPDE